VYGILAKVIRDWSAAGLGDRGRVLVYVAVSGIMLASSVTIRLSAPSPFAPRVHVRWAEGIADAQRSQLEERFVLLAGRRRDGSTWEYDLAEPSPSTIQALLRSPAVGDTHYIDRSTGAAAPNAPRGTTRLNQGRLVAWIHSRLFDWLMAFWASSLFVSSVWLACPPDLRRR